MLTLYQNHIDGVMVIVFPWSVVDRGIESRGSGQTRSGVDRGIESRGSGQTKE